MHLHPATNRLLPTASSSSAESPDAQLEWRLHRAAEMETRVRLLADRLLQELHRVRAECPPRMPWRCRWRHALKNVCGVRLGQLWQHEPRPLRLPAHYSRTPRPAACPTIALVTPSFNHGPFLARTLTSVLAQRYPCLEYVVQDGGSTDETPDLLEQYHAQLTHCESSADRGQAHALNRGFRHTTGEVMGYLNSDDLLLPGALNYIASYFAAHSEVDVVYGHRVLIDHKGHEVGRWVMPAHNDAVLSWADYIPQETLFWRRRVWDRVGGAFDESFQFALDWDLILRFRDAGARFARLPRFLGAFRVHALQKTMLQLAGLGEEEMDRLRERCHGRPVTHLEIHRHLRGYFARHAICHRLYQWGLLGH